MKQASFFEAAGAVVEISSSLQITNCNQVKLAQILDTHCISVSSYLVVEVDKEERWDDSDDEESGPGRVEDCVVGMLPQIRHLHHIMPIS